MRRSNRNQSVPISSIRIPPSSSSVTATSSESPNPFSIARISPAVATFAKDLGVWFDRIFSMQSCGMFSSRLPSCARL